MLGPRIISVKPSAGQVSLSSFGGEGWGEEAVCSSLVPGSGGGAALRVEVHGEGELITQRHGYGSVGRDPARSKDAGVSSGLFRLPGQPNLADMVGGDRGIEVATITVD